MKRNKLHLVSLPFIAFFFYVSLSSNSAGITGVSSCTGSGCHDQSLSTIHQYSGIPAGGYVPGVVYTITVGLYNPNKVAGGFNFKVNGGTISNPSAGTALNGSNEIYHTTPKLLVSGSATWTFDWTAPPTPSVGWTLYVNAVDNTGTSSNDECNHLLSGWTKASSTATPPSIVSNSITMLNSNSVNIASSVNPNGTNTAVTIDYGITTSYGSSASTSPSSISGTSATNVSATLTGLTSNTLYHYRINATNSAGTSYSNDSTFLTLLYPLEVNDYKEELFKIYPNPTNSNLTISSKIQMKNVVVQFYSIYGELMNTNLLSQNKNNFKFDIQYFNPGVYFLLIEFDNKRYRYSFIKRE